MKNRVVVTGLGVVAPNGNGIKEFEAALRAGKSGEEYLEVLKEHNFACQVACIPKNIEEIQGEALPAP